MTFIPQVSLALNAKRGKRDDGESETFIAAPLEASDGHHGYSSPRGDGADNLVSNSASVRRLTPTECMRLQGLPDNWFDDVPGTSDSKMYAALGDAVTVPVPYFIGRRLIDHDRAGRAEARGHDSEEA